MKRIATSFVYFLFLMLVFIQNDTYAESAVSEMTMTKEQIQATLSDIDTQIQNLQKKRKELNYRAKYFDREAFRVQFIDFAYYQELLRKERRCKEMIAGIDAQIAALQKDKERLQASIK